MSREIEDVIEENQDFLLKAYYDLYRLCLVKDGVNDQSTPLWETLRELETGLTGLGLLEPDEEEAEDEEEELDYTNDATHWDEWTADQRYDVYRDLALEGYEY